jgi:8-oxo-dGTP diphosphatase
MSLICEDQIPKLPDVFADYDWSIPPRPESQVATEHHPTFQRYVAGLYFWQNQVLLIRKQKPAFMNGKLNGIGGKMEDRESPLSAMIREFEEETGLHERDWQHFATLQGRNFEVEWFKCEKAYQGSRPVSLDPEIEKTEWVNVSDVRYGNPMNNLTWLIQMAYADTGDNFPYLVKERVR